MNQYIIIFVLTSILSSCNFFKPDIIEWVKIEGGGFYMGSNNNNTNERPVHAVSLENFYISKTEVTVGQYRKCVEAGACSNPSNTRIKNQKVDEWFTVNNDQNAYCNWTYNDRENHPMNCVNWYQAKMFAKWIGGNLPSEAQWEYAARSRGKEIRYPWGNQSPSCEYAVLNTGSAFSFKTETRGCGENRTFPVCSKVKGNTEQGLCDMTGNVYEIVLDEYHDSYLGAPGDGSAWCSTSDCSNNQSMNYRGGSWGDTFMLGGIFTTFRGASLFGITIPTTKQDPSIGFRVVKN